MQIAQIKRLGQEVHSTEPERLRMIATIFVACFGIFSVVWILFIGAREHGY